MPKPSRKMPISSIHEKQKDAGFKECIMGGSIIGTQCVHDFSSTLSQEQYIYNPQSAMKLKKKKHPGKVIIVTMTPQSVMQKFNHLKF